MEGAPGGQPQLSGKAGRVLVFSLCVSKLRQPPQKRRFPPPKGAWKPRKISNPDYFEDLHPFEMTAVRAVGLELWSMTSDIYFDNFIVTSQKEVADRWASDSWGLKKLVASANEVSPPPPPPSRLPSGAGEGPSRAPALVLAPSRGSWPS